MVPVTYVVAAWLGAEQAKDDNARTMAEAMDLRI
jgi:hypothetical protein